ncbi:GmrSD restriction endonuclease domain-containing protein [Luteimicrobium sp. DT211]|uniref:GmrSD restriction endonuclease domain-containing protein n=1 Tax=Luteimicrobium sp. DT211 TaxID=3393412 RepID=UPI003CF64B70
MSLPPAGWYADPAEPGRVRWWDGSRWTDQARPAAPPDAVRQDDGPTPDDGPPPDLMGPTASREHPPGSAPAPRPPTAAPRRARPTLWPWLVAVGAVLLGALGGVSSALIAGGLAAGAIGIVGLATHRGAVGRRRGLSAGVTGAAVVALIAGGAVAGTDDDPTPPSAGSAATSATDAPTPTVSRSAPPSGTPSPTAPTPTPTSAPRATSSARPTPTLTPTVPRATTGAKTTALSVLALLPVKGRAPMTGYERSAFGPAWADVDRNGCDTRNDILARDLRRTTTKPGTHGCVILTGTLVDPYSGRTIAFTRGVRTSTAVEIDHVVALADAWQTGAQKWDATTREKYANDPLVLLASDGPLNEQKGASDAASWLPPNKAFRCQYVARQVGIKRVWHLWVTRAEHDAITRILATCPNQPVPSGATKPRVIPKPAAMPTPAPMRRAAVPPPAAGKHPSTTAPLDHWNCPSWAPIKGNESSHIFHMPGGQYYDRTAPEVCFATKAAAIAHGYRQSKR